MYLEEAHQKGSIVLEASINQFEMDTRTDREDPGAFEEAYGNDQTGNRIFE
jgi:hypothetical protein